MYGREAMKLPCTIDSSIKLYEWKNNGSGWEGLIVTAHRLCQWDIL